MQHYELSRTYGGAYKEVLQKRHYTCHILGGMEKKENKNKPQVPASSFFQNFRTRSLFFLAWPEKANDEIEVLNFGQLYQRAA